MKELELTLENLFSLGLTPEILKTDFENWVVENKDISIDFKNEIIYYDLINYKKELANSLVITKNEMVKSGLSVEEVELLFQKEREQQDAGFSKVLNELPDEEKLEFIHHVMPKLRDQFYEDKKQFFDTKLAEILKSSTVSLTDKKSDINVSNVETNSNLSIQENNTEILDCIDRNLWNWLKEYEITNEYISIPLAIEDKADYVTDTYKNYEERNYKYQIEICNCILEKVPNEQKILDYKSKFQKKIIELRKQYPIPSVNIEVIISDINNAFFRLEKFMEGSITTYQSFLFNDAFTLFFNELSKPENVTPRNFNLRDGYHNLLYHIDYAFDKGEFKNQDAYLNTDFERDCNEICYIHFYRSSEFGISTDLDDLPFKMPSILDLTKQPENNTPEIINIEFEDKISLTDKENPYPKIFKNHKAYTIFKNLLDEFGNTKENLSNYSFIFHKMTYEDLIHYDLKQKSYFDFLGQFDISISRIKSMNEIGKIAFRESIYFKAKS